MFFGIKLFVPKEFLELINLFKEISLFSMLNDHHTYTSNKMSCWVTRPTKGLVL